MLCECLRCGADLRGPVIDPDMLFLYGGRQKCDECGHASHYSRVVGLYDHVQDVTVAYLCPDCGFRKDRYD